ncbi:hypothetical protein PTKIN_Ptkin03bG0101500 [Pterospermum kingtungense]
MGLSLTTPGKHSLNNHTTCNARIDMDKKLVVFKVASFRFFLLPWCLKLAINLLNNKDIDEAFRAYFSLKTLRCGMIGSTVGSVMGCLYLVLSMVNVIEIQLRRLSFGSKSVVQEVKVMVILVSSALFVYISTIVYSFF